MANAIAHLWQTYNARLQPGPPQLLPTGVPKPPPVRMIPGFKPVPAVPVGVTQPGNTGGVGGLFFQSNPASPDEPLQVETQQEFQNRYDESVLTKFPPLGGGGDVD